MISSVLLALIVVLTAALSYWFRQRIPDTFLARIQVAAVAPVAVVGITTMPMFIFSSHSLASVLTNQLFVFVFSLVLSYLVVLFVTDR